MVVAKVRLLLLGLHAARLCSFDRAFCLSKKLLPQHFCVVELSLATHTIAAATAHRQNTG